MYKCKVCEKEFGHAGARNLHERACKVKAYEMMNQESREKVEEYDNEVCLHAWKVLNANIQVEFAAILQGYRKVCSKCQTLQ